MSPSSRRPVSHRDVMTCRSEGNPDPSYHWTAALLHDSAAVITVTGPELTVDVCQLTAWNHRSETRRRNVSGTASLMLTCHAQNRVHGELRTGSIRETYNLVSLKNMDQVCSGESIRPFERSRFGCSRFCHGAENQVHVGRHGKNVLFKVLNQYRQNVVRSY